MSCFFLHTRAQSCQVATYTSAGTFLEAQATYPSPINMLIASAKPTVHLSRDKLGGTCNVHAYRAHAMTARWPRLLHPGHLRYRHWCHMQPNMHRRQPILFSILHLTVEAMASCDFDTEPAKAALSMTKCIQFWVLPLNNARRTSMLPRPPEAPHTNKFYR
jgi:hypothetical protein